MLLKHRRRVELVLHSLGLTRNVDKGHWDPTTTLQHLGLTVSTTNKGGEYSIPEDKQKRIRQFAKDLIQEGKRNRRLVPVRRIAAFAGLAQSVYLALPCARMFLRSLHDCVATKRGWESRVRLSRQAIRDLGWWTLLPQESIGRSLWTSPTTRTVSSDASGHSWGGTFEGQWAHGRFDKQWRKEHITVKEMLGAHLVCESFIKELQGQHVRFLEDNQAVVYMVRSRTSRSPVLMGLIRRFYAMLDLASIKISIEYINTKLNTADAPSRFVDRADWTISPGLWATIQEMHGPHTHDCFASDQSALLPIYDVKYQSALCKTGDTFSQQWDAPRRNNFCNPGWQAYVRPYELLERVGHFLQQTPAAAATVLCPYRPGRNHSPRGFIHGNELEK